MPYSLQLESHHVYRMVQVAMDLRKECCNISCQWKYICERSCHSQVKPEELHETKFRPTRLVAQICPSIAHAMKHSSNHRHWDHRWSGTVLYNSIGFSRHHTFLKKVEGYKLVVSDVQPRKAYAMYLAWTWRYLSDASTSSLHKFSRHPDDMGLDIPGSQRVVGEGRSPGRSSFEQSPSLCTRSGGWGSSFWSLFKEDCNFDSFCWAELYVQRDRFPHLI